MEQQEVLDLLRKTGALVDGHFVNDDGAHADAMIRVAKVAQFALWNRKLAFEIVRHFLELDIHVVIGLSVGAIPTAVEVGRQLEARTIYIEEVDGRPVLRRGFQLHHGERVVLVQDHLRSTRELSPAIALIRAADARVIGVGAVVDSREEITTHTFKNVAAIRLRPNLYAAADCRLCADHVPLSEDAATTDDR
jgi:orotate phosphoribosyltransferase